MRTGIINHDGYITQSRFNKNNQHNAACCGTAGFVLPRTNDGGDLDDFDGGTLARPGATRLPHRTLAVSVFGPTEK